MCTLFYGQYSLVCLQVLLWCCLGLLWGLGHLVFCVRAILVIMLIYKCDIVFYVFGDWDNLF